MNDNLPKVIVGPSCSKSLRIGVEQGLKRLFGERFDLTPIVVERFKDGDSLIQICDNVRGQQVYAVQSGNHPAENIEHMNMILDAAANANAAGVTPVFPYFPGRQDRKDRPRVGITAAQRVSAVKEILRFVTHKQAMVFEPHSDQLHLAFWPMPCDFLWATDILLSAFEEKFPNIEHLKPAGPDAGSIKLIRKLAEFLDVDDYAHGDKSRKKTDSAKIRNIIGDIEGMSLLVRDDIIDTGGSFHDFVFKAEELGATACYGLVGHGVLAGDAIKKLLHAHDKSILKHVFITDSINNERRRLPRKLFTVVSCGDLIAHAIYENHTLGSISSIDGMFSRRRANQLEDKSE